MRTNLRTQERYVCSSDFKARNQKELMAEYSYNGGSTERSKLGFRFPVRNYTYENGAREWSKPGYGEKGDTYRDHVRRPVVVDSERKAVPGVFIMPNQQISHASVTNSETVVRHGYSPQGYTRSSATKAEILRDSADPESGWGKKEAYVDPTPGGNEYIGMNRKGGLPLGLFQRQSAFPKTYGGSHETGTKGWSNPKYDTVPQPKYDSVPQPKHESYRGKEDASHETRTKEWNSPKYNTVHQPNHDSYHGKDDRRLDDLYSATPHSKVGNGFNRGVPPPARNYDSPLTKPTNEIGAPADCLKEPARTTVTVAPQQGYLSAPSVVTKQTYDTGPLANYVKEQARTPLVTEAPQQGRSLVSPVSHRKKPAHETIDSKEAERRYGSLPNTVPKVEKSLPAIDSKTAAQIYKGTLVPAKSGIQ